MPGWVVEILNETVETELEALPDRMLARFWKIVELIEELGLERVHEPHIKQVEGKLWEMRMKSPEGIARALYVTAPSKRVVVVRVFVKKTPKTPRDEIKIARDRAKEL